MGILDRIFGDKGESEYKDTLTQASTPLIGLIEALPENTARKKS